MNLFLVASRDAAFVFEPADGSFRNVAEAVFGFVKSGVTLFVRLAGEDVFDAAAFEPSAILLPAVILVTRHGLGPRASFPLGQWNRF